MTGSSNTSDEVRRWVAQSLAIDAHTAEVVTALNAAGIPSVLLKGPSIARWLYTDGTPRPYGDTDLLVPDDRMREVEQVLEGLGLVHHRPPLLEFDPRQHATNWARRDGSGHVDLHWTLPMVGSPGAVWAVVLRDAESMVVGGAAVLIESEPMRALHTALHAVQHGPECGKPLEDLRRALRQVEHDTWVRALGLAEELDAVAPMGLGLQLLPEGATLVGHLGIDVTGATAEVLLRAQGAPRAARSLAHVLAQPTWRERVRLARTAVFPSASYVRSWDQGSHAHRGGVVGAYWRRLWRGMSAVPGIVRTRAHWRGRSNRP